MLVIMIYGFFRNWFLLKREIPEVVLAEVSTRVIRIVERSRPVA